jgi:DNA-directed RNA polymerase specialized sigma subunit
VTSKRPRWETLIGDDSILEFLASKQEPGDEHPLQRRVEEIIETHLTEDEKTLFYMRFGERLPHRTIARQLGYDSHMTFQVKIQAIMDKVRKALEEDG